MERDINIQIGDDARDYVAEQQTDERLEEHEKRKEEEKKQ